MNPKLDWRFALGIFVGILLSNAVAPLWEKVPLSVAYAFLAGMVVLAVWEVGRRVYTRKIKKS